MKPVLQHAPAEKAKENPDPPAFKLIRPEGRAAPVIFASPHSGRFYPTAFLDKLDVPLADLRRTEDAFMDELFESCVQHGGTQLVANYGRCYIDLNRDSRELDPDMYEDGVPRACGMPSARVRAGLGCVPRVAASGRQIYREKLSREDGQARLDRIYDPYHACLAGEIEKFAEAWSHVVVVDCHSMPSAQPGRPDLPDIVLGDRFGSSCHHRLTSLVERTFRGLGRSVVRNAPYAGGYTTRRYGRPRRGCSVLQIEINRALYMREADISLHDGFETLRSDLDSVVEAITDFAVQHAS